MSRRRTAAIAVVALTVPALALAGCGKQANQPASSSAAAPTSASGSAAPTSEESSSSAAPTTELATTTPAGTKPLDAITWVVYRDVQTIDPIYVYDYPDNAAIALLCESLGRQAPDGTIGDGLATLTRPDDKTMVYTINPAAKFWDGSPVTADDVVYSLGRQMNADLGEIGRAHV